MNIVVCVCMQILTKNRMSYDVICVYHTLYIHRVRVASPESPTTHYHIKVVVVRRGDQKQRECVRAISLRPISAASEGYSVILRRRLSLHIIYVQILNTAYACGRLNNPAIY